MIVNGGDKVTLDMSMKKLIGIKYGVCAQCTHKKGRIQQELFLETMRTFAMI